MVIHTVQPGESVQSIAQQYGVSSYRLTVENGLEFPVRLAVGQAQMCIRDSPRSAQR